MAHNPAFCLGRSAHRFHGPPGRPVKTGGERRKPSCATRGLVGEVSSAADERLWSSGGWPSLPWLLLWLVVRGRCISQRPAADVEWVLALETTDSLTPTAACRCRLNQGPVAPLTTLSQAVRPCPALPPANVLVATRLRAVGVACSALFEWNAGASFFVTSPAPRLILPIYLQKTGAL